MIAEIPKDATCQFEGCDRAATHIACGGEYSEEWPAPAQDAVSHPRPAVYCRDHAYEVACESDPEYTPDCPNCGCVFGY